MYCRKIGYLYERENGGPVCRGCVKTIEKADVIRICLYPMANCLKEGMTGIALVFGHGAERVSVSLADFCFRRSIGEYCFAYEKRKEQRAPLVGIVLSGGGRTVYGTWEEHFLDLSVDKGAKELTCADDARCESGGVVETLQEDVDCESGGVVEASQEPACAIKELSQAVRELREVAAEPAGTPELCARELFMRRHSLAPMPGSGFVRCVRISLSDVRLVLQEGGIRRSNSFLCHSYYRYRHLMLAERSDGQRKSCWLLAPGIGNPREQQLSSVYGFSGFFPVSGQSGRHGFGYWGMELFF